MPMPKTVCRTNVYNKIVQLEVCVFCSGRGMGMNITAQKLDRPAAAAAGAAKYLLCFYVCVCPRYCRCHFHCAAAVTGAAACPASCNLSSMHKQREKRYAVRQEVVSLGGEANALAMTCSGVGATWVEHSFGGSGVTGALLIRDWASQTVFSCCALRCPLSAVNCLGALLVACAL